MKIWPLTAICKKFVNGILIKFEHLSLIDFKAFCLPDQIINYFTDIYVRIWLYHYKSSFAVLAQVFFCESVCEFHNFEPPSVNIKSVADKQILLNQPRILNPF